MTSPFAAGVPRAPRSPLGLRPHDTNPSIPLSKPVQPQVQPPQAPLINPLPATSAVGPYASNAPQAPQQTFGPGNDLRSTQINSAPSARLTAAQGATGTAAQGVQNFNRGQSVTGYTGQFGQQLAPKAVGFRGVNASVSAPTLNTQVGMRPAPTNAAFRGVNPNIEARSVLAGGPNRTDIAKNTLALFNEQSNLDRQQGIRSIGQSAARFGRIGAGMTTNDLTGLEASLDRNRRVQENDLASRVAEGDISDRFRDRDYLTSVDEGNYGRATNERDAELGLSERNIGRERTDRDIALGLDEANVGRAMQDRDFTTGLAERNVGRGINERDTELGLDERNAGRDFDARRTALEMALGMGNAEGSDALNRFRTASDYEGSIYGNEFDARNEQRGERGYQEELARFAHEQRIRQRQMENEEQQAEFQRGYDRSRLGMAGSGQTADGADGAYDLLMDYMRRRQANSAAGQKARDA